MGFTGWINAKTHGRQRSGVNIFHSYSIFSMGIVGIDHRSPFYLYQAIQFDSSYPRPGPIFVKKLFNRKNGCLDSMSGASFNDVGDINFGDK